MQLGARQRLPHRNYAPSRGNPNDLGDAWVWRVIALPSRVRVVHYLSHQRSEKEATASVLESGLTSTNQQSQVATANPSNGGRADGSHVDFGGITVIPCAPRRGHMTFPSIGDQHQILKVSNIKSLILSSPFPYILPLFLYPQLTAEELLICLICYCT
jgi:hypothetical protein